MPLTHKHAALLVLVLIATLVVYGYWQDRHGVAPHTPATPAVCPTPAPCGTCPGPPAPLVCPPTPMCARMDEKPAQGTVRTLQGWVPGLDGDYACVSIDNGAELYARITPGTYGGLRMNYNATTKVMSMSPDVASPTVVPPGVLLQQTGTPPFTSPVTVHFSAVGGADGASVAGSTRVLNTGNGYSGNGVYTYLTTDAAGWDLYVMPPAGWAQPGNYGALTLVKFHSAEGLLTYHSVAGLLRSEHDPTWPALTALGDWSYPVAPGNAIPMPGRTVTFVPGTAA